MHASFNLIKHKDNFYWFFDGPRKIVDAELFYFDLSLYSWHNDQIESLHEFYELLQRNFLLGLVRKKERVETSPPPTRFAISKLKMSKGKKTTKWTI